MLAKERNLYIIFALPGVFGLIRVLTTIWYFAKNPFGMPLRYLQLIPMFAVLVALFMYFKLYSDGIPIISVIAPTILHFVLIVVFQKRVVLIPFIAPLLLDVVFLVMKGIKAELFPFDIESDEDEETRVIEELFGGNS